MIIVSGFSTLPILDIKKEILKTEDMENNVKMLESLIEKAEDYGKSGIELVKLKVVDKTSEIISSMIPYTVVFLLIASFLIFLNLGLAFWLGDILGKTYFGFFIVAAFYILTGSIFYLFFHKRIKSYICNSLINNMLK
ncbi:MAG: hypothetical protein WD052_13600 [Bacteroidales bacterium]